MVTYTGEEFHNYTFNLSSNIKKFNKKFLLENIGKECITNHFVSRASTPIQWAAEHGYLEIVKWLDRHGADITSRDNWAVKWAARNGHLEVVKYLHKKDADVTANNNWAIKHAATNGRLEVVKWLNHNGADITADGNKTIKWAADYGHSEVVKYLHENGAGCNNFTVSHSRNTEYIRPNNDRIGLNNDMFLIFFMLFAFLSITCVKWLF